MTSPDTSYCLPALTVLAVAASLLGCAPQDAEPGQGKAYFDEPHQVPLGVPYEGKDPVADEPETVASADECGRGRGIDPDGNCVPLVTREHEFGGMVQIPAGAFMRGDIPARYNATSGRERPHHEHAGQPLFQDQLPSYWIDGYEVSRKAYSKCVEAGSCSPAVCLDGTDGRPTDRQLGDAELDAFPQTCVTHEQAEAYCSSRGHRLPSEAEWEYAARGPEGWMFPWGHEFRDELGLALGPVGYDPLDVSYFGLKGFGGNAIEWVADAYEGDANLSRYLGGEFRKKDGPLARSWAAWKRGLCGGSDCDLGTRYVIKGGRSGARAAAWQLAKGQTIAEPPANNFEDDRAIAQHERLGFRCAADLEPDATVLTVPKPVAPLPLYRQVDGYDLFLGVAEAVDREEAARFCSVLIAPGDPKELPEGGNGWRLPTLEEIRAVSVWFGGPGPFWAVEGAAEQTFVDTQTAEWDMVEATDDEALMARCIRSR
ncbi:Hercynine oxygenase [Enhygromyxa salina]|uniref:Hercynine oxygenase n=1 Tax=Enhygromyxa salina TaxID=215803 RepID=A0A2S9XXW4_9BACT|nr:SUMF1/EgtB/PvdO family nonheme iron enzyme [Enhygromyxa salina]PRP97570.1 Hercynine oxygenase [Enhygromyxa salina]